MAMGNVVRWFFIAVMLTAAAWVSWAELVEAYGSGPPYFGRTTNMDKWSSPWPLVVVVDAAALAVAVLLRPRRGKAAP